MDSRRDRLTLYWKGYHGTLCEGWYPGRVGDRPLFKQLIREAGIGGRNQSSIADDEMDSLLNVASAHGLWIETIKRQPQ